MKIGKEGLELIKKFEGCKLEAYYCPAKVLTIGVGHTGPDVKVGTKITQEEADNILRKDLERFEKGVEGALKVGVNQNQFDALVSFAFNCGLGALHSSTLLKKLNKGNYKAAASEFLKWNKARGKVLAGLTKRRQAEKLLFENKVNETGLPYKVRTTTELNIRALPGTQAKIIKKVPKGTVLKVWAIQTINGEQWGKNGKEHFHLGYTERI